MTEETVPARGSLSSVDGVDFETRWAAVQRLQAQGWTQEGAMNHIEGMCDPMICCGWDD